MIVLPSLLKYETQETCKQVKNMKHVKQVSVNMHVKLLSKVEVHVLAFYQMLTSVSKSTSVILQPDLKNRDLVGLRLVG